MSPTCFGLRPSSGSLQLSLSRVILILKYSVRLRRNLLCGGVAACPSVACVLCSAQHTVHMPHWDMPVVILKHRPHLPPENSLRTHFSWRLNRPQGHSAIGRIMSMKNSNDTICKRTSDLPICSTVP